MTHECQRFHNHKSDVKIPVLTSVSKAKMEIYIADIYICPSSVEAKMYLFNRCSIDAWICISIERSRRYETLFSLNIAQFLFTPFTGIL